MSATGTEARVCQDIAKRQQVGLSKYGTTVEANPLGMVQWIRHAYEECLDQAVYLRRCLEVLEGPQIEIIGSGGSGWAGTLGQTVHSSQCQQASDQSTTLEDGSVLTATAGKAIEGGVFEFWWADHMPKATQAEAWREWIALSDHVREDPADRHHELRKTWKPGQRWEQAAPGSDMWHPCNSERGPLWDSWMQYRCHPEDREPPTTEKPWYPDNSGEWVEVPDDCVDCPVDPSEMVMSLSRFERETRNWIGQSITNARDWHWPNLVAYKVVK